MKYSICRCLATSFALVIIYGSTIAQPLPRMFVNRAKSQQRQEWFKTGTARSKLQILDDLTFRNQQISYSFNTQKFLSLRQSIFANQPLADAIKIYIAIFDNRFPVPVPAGVLTDKQIVILFTPAKTIKALPYGYASNLGKYHYFLIPGQQSAIRVDTVTSNKWIRNFFTTVCQANRGFNSTIVQDAPENMYEGMPFDTRSIYFEKSDFDDLFTKEIAIQHDNHGVHVTGVQMNLAAYPDTGNDDHEYVNRVLIQFELLKKGKNSNDDEIVYIEAENDFPERQQARDKIYEIEKLKDPSNKELKWNNGQLCPVNCPPPGDSPGRMKKVSKKINPK